MKFMSAILVLAMLVGLVACGSEAPPTETTASSGETNLAETTGEPRLDDLPELDFEGETVTFLYRSEKANEFYSESETGDVVDDAIYQSIISVEERLNIDIEVISREGHYNPARDEYNNHITNTVLAGDATYDWVDMLLGYIPEKITNGIFSDLSTNKYIDITKPYYLADLKNVAMLNNRLYFVSGDASLGYMKTAFCIYFNQRLADDFKLGDLYETVESGKWTLDKAIELAAATSQDVNGDNVYDLNDKLGFVVHDRYSMCGFLGSNDVSPFTKNSSGKWELTFGSERDVAVVEKMQTLMHHTAGVFNSMVSNGNANDVEKYNEITAKFASGDIFMMTAEFDDSVVGLRDMKDNFGILPYPKYDESQESYRSLSRSTQNAFAMPVTSEKSDAAGAVMEALASSNHETVLPTYFETALKTKYSRDNGSARMYDLIRESMYLDFCYTYSRVTGNVMDIFRDSIEKETSLATDIAGKRSQIETKLTEYIDTVTNLG